MSETKMQNWDIKEHKINLADFINPYQYGQFFGYFLGNIAYDFQKSLAISPRKSLKKQSKRFFFSQISLTILKFST